MTTTPNVILLAGNVGQRYEEARASGILKPGHLIMLDSDGKVLKQNGVGVRCEKIFALEDSLQGKIITDAYAVDDLVPYKITQPGDVVYARLPAAAPAVTKATFLQSNGDGCLIGIPIGGVQSLYASAADSAAIGASSTAEAAFDKSYTIPANSLRVGDVIHVRAVARVVAANSTDTLTLRLKIGSTTVIATGAVNITDADPGIIDAYLIVRTIGASGTFVANGEYGLGVTGTAAMTPWLLVSTAIDTTVTKAITVTGQMSASGANSIVLQSLTVDLIRTSASVSLAMAMESVDNSLGASEAFVRARILG